MKTILFLPFLLLSCAPPPQDLEITGPEPEYSRQNPLYLPPNQNRQVSPADNNQTPFDPRLPSINAEQQTKTEDPPLINPTPVVQEDPPLESRRDPIDEDDGQVEPFEGPISLSNMPYAREFSYPMGGELDHSGVQLSYPLGSPVGHLGDDYFVRDVGGDQIYAIADGVVYFVRYVASLGRNSNWMDVVIVRHRVKDLDDDDEYVYSFYGHIKAVAGLSPGKIIKRRQLIGETTDIIPAQGQSDFAIHLHLELRNTVAVDQCSGCYPSDKVGTGYSNKSEFGDKDRSQGYYEPSGQPRNRRYYNSDAFIKARLP